MPLTNSITHNTFLLHLHSINLLDSKKFHNFGVITKNTNIMKKIFYFTAIVLAFLLCSGQTIVCPPTGHSFYPDMEDCTAYYECDNGVLSHFECSAGLLFNAEMKTCAAPASVDCQERPIPEESGGGSDIYYYWKELKDQSCKCFLPNDTYVIKTGTTCVTNGNGEECSYSGLCSVPRYGTCFKAN